MILRAPATGKSIEYLAGYSCEFEVDLVPLFCTLFQETRRRAGRVRSFHMQTKMNENLAQSTSLELTLAHLLVLRALASDKLAGVPLNENFSEIEKKAIWILEDVIDQKLIDLKVESRLAKEWDELTSRAAEQLDTQPFDFLP